VHDDFPVSRRAVRPSRRALCHCPGRYAARGRAGSARPGGPPAPKVRPRPHWPPDQQISAGLRRSRSPCGIGSRPGSMPRPAWRHRFRAPAMATRIPLCRRARLFRQSAERHFRAI